MELLLSNNSKLFEEVGVVTFLDKMKGSPICLSNTYYLVFGKVLQLLYTRVTINFRYI